MNLHIDTTKEICVFDNSNYYYLDDYAKMQGYKGYNDISFIHDFNLEDYPYENDIFIDEWLTDTRNYDIETLLNEYECLSKDYYIIGVAYLETWNKKGYSTITPIKNITDIFNYGCSSCELIDIYEGEKYIKFDISHHDGNDTFYIFFSNEQYNIDLFDDLNNSVSDCINYEIYKKLENKCEDLYHKIIKEYDNNYLNNCISIRQLLRGK